MRVRMCARVSGTESRRFLHAATEKAKVWLETMENILRLHKNRIKHQQLLIITRAINSVCTSLLSPNRTPPKTGHAIVVLCSRLRQACKEI